MSAEGERGCRRWFPFVAKAVRGHAISVLAARVVGTAVRAVRAIVKVVHFRAAPPGDLVNVAEVVEEVAPKKIAGAILGLVEPQFWAARGI